MRRKPENDSNRRKRQGYEHTQTSFSSKQDKVSSYHLWWRRRLEFAGVEAAGKTRRKRKHLMLGSGRKR